MLYGKSTPVQEQSPFTWGMGAGLTVGLTVRLYPGGAGCFIGTRTRTHPTPRNSPSPAIKLSALGNARHFFVARFKFTTSFCIYSPRLVHIFLVQDTCLSLHFTVGDTPCPRQARTAPGQPAH